MEDTVKVFLDKAGKEIKPGDILRHDFYTRCRERPGHKRITINGMSGNESIVSDEGQLLGAKKGWITYKVGRSGACLIAKRFKSSDFQAISSSELFDNEGNHIYEGAGFHYFNSTFDSTVYRITP